MSTALPANSRKIPLTHLKEGDRVEVGVEEGTERGEVRLVEQGHGEIKPIVLVLTDTGQFVWRAPASIRLLTAIERLGDVIESQ